MEEGKAIWTAVKCPHCGYEHELSEILMPGDLIGRPETVIRDALGKIIYVEWREGEEPVKETVYECDGCGRPFVAEFEVKAKARKQEEELDFSDVSSSLLGD